MNILPKTTQEFASKEYWDRFFDQRKDSFEWYGSYAEIKPILISYVKPNDKILVIGCGNSTLSVDLYDDGYCNNTSIDISEIVIEKMIAKHKKNGARDKLVLECMDILQMTYPDEAFNVVIDKGTLDAVASDDFDLDRMFSEISRVLASFGRYVCVTLLQERILMKFLSWFLDSKQWICRIHRCPVEKSQAKVDVVDFPVFIVVCTKLKCKLPNTVIELDLNGDKNFQKFQDISQVAKAVKSVQNIEFLKYFIRNNKITEDNFHIELYDRCNTADSRYLLYFVQKSAAISNNLRCSVFIVPQGREHEWMFSTSKGREHLLKQCRSNRMVVVTLSRKHRYDSMDHIKDELSQQITDFFPADAGKISFLSLCDDIGSRNLLWEGSSPVNGQMFVEDVAIDDSLYRRLVFAQNRNIIQSEARMKLDKSKKYYLDHQFLSCDHHELIASMLAITNRPYKESYRLLMIGLGGGCFVNFIAHNLKADVQLNIEIVEIDPLMEEIAQKYFEFGKQKPKNLTVEVIIQDGLNYLAQAAQSVDYAKRFDFIVFDVDSKNLESGISCPPEPFIAKEFLEQVKTCMTTDGFFILNLVARDDDIKREIYHRLKNLFERCYQNKVKDDVNEIILATDSENEWLTIKDPNRRLDMVQKSCFHIPLLEQTYRQMCRKIRPL